MEHIQRMALAVEIFDKLLSATESFEENYVGSDLAYLMGAILKEESFDLDPLYHEYFQKLLKKNFKKSHPVWKFIKRMK